MNGEQNFESYNTDMDTGAGFSGNVNTRIKDLEEKQRILKDRLLLIGENLIETKEDVDEKILEIKKNIETIKQNMERMMSFLESASKEFSKFAKKEDLDILIKQAKMFQPLGSIKKTKKSKK